MHFSGWVQSRDRKLYPSRMIVWFSARAVEASRSVIVQSCSGFLNQLLKLLQPASAADNLRNDDDCFYYYKKWVSSPDVIKSILHLRLSVVLRSHLLFFFFGRRNVWKEKVISPRSHSASYHMHTHVMIACMQLVYIDEYIWAEI